MVLYRKSDPSVWTGRGDGYKKDRFFSRVICVNLDNLKNYSDKFVLLGFSCDEGVRRNFGRPGAKEGPKAIRENLRNLAVHFDKKINILDLGDVVCEENELEEAQEKLSELVSLIRLLDKFPLVLGGGHETAWGHFKGLKHDLISSKLGIVNFDAHFDLREVDKENLPSSGTPFFQASKMCESLNQDFRYFAVGIENFSNTSFLFERAKNLGVKVIKREEIEEDMKKAQERLELFCGSCDKIYLTLCLDVISSAWAQGVSAVNPFGLNPSQVFRLLKIMIESKKIISFDLVELAPCLDLDGKTSKLAASLIILFLETIMFLS